MRGIDAVFLELVLDIVKQKIWVGFPVWIGGDGDMNSVLGHPDFSGERGFAGRGQFVVVCQDLVKILFVVQAHRHRRLNLDGNSGPLGTGLDGFFQGLLFNLAGTDGFQNIYIRTEILFK